MAEAPGPGEPIVLGWLGAVHGLRGAFRFLPETDFPERLRAGRAVSLVPAGGGPTLATRIARAQPMGGRLWLLSVDGVDSPAAARPFVGGSVCVAAADLPPLPPGQFYHHQLVGLSVLDAGGATVGRVTEVQTAPANDIYVVRRPDGRRVLVPAVRAAVAAIDVASGVMRLADLPGLLD